MKESRHQGIVRDERGQEQPVDKERAQNAPQTKSQGSVSRERTRDRKLDDTAAPDSEGNAT